MNEDRFEMLRNAIVIQAVDDYCTSVRKIAELNAKTIAINKIVADGKKGKRPRYYTLEEADAERKYRIKMHMARINEVEDFFFSEWYKNLCSIDCDYMLYNTKQKAITDLVEKCIYNLKKIKKKNLHSKKSQKSLKEFEILKQFLCSEWLKKFTEKDAESILQHMKNESKCEWCDFCV